MLSVNKYVSKLCAHFIVLLISTSSAYAQSDKSPEIIFDRFANEEVSGVFVSPNPLAKGEPATFYRLLLQKPSDLQESFFDKTRYKDTFVQNYLIRTPKFKITYTYQGSYIIKEDKIIGYLLLEPLGIINDKNTPDSVVKQMEQFPRNQTFENNFPVLEHHRVFAYEKSHDDFKERYTFVAYTDDLGEAHLTLIEDAFFPIELESKMNLKTIQYIQDYLQELSPVTE